MSCNSLNDIDDQRLSNDIYRPTTYHEINDNQHLYQYHKESKMKKRKYNQIIDGGADEQGDDCSKPIKRKKSKKTCPSVMLSQNNVEEVSNRNKCVHGSMSTLMSENSCRRFDYYGLMDDESRRDDDKENETKQQQDIQHEHNIGYYHKNQQPGSLFTTTLNTNHKSQKNVMNQSVLLSCRDKELIQRAFILGVMKSQVHVRNNTCISTVSHDDSITNRTRKGFNTKTLQNDYSTIDPGNNNIDYRNMGSCHNNLKENNQRGFKTRNLSRCDHEEWCDWEHFKNKKKKIKNNKITLQWDFMKYHNDDSSNSLYGVEEIYEINSITNDLHHNNLKEEENVVDDVSEHDDDSPTENS